MANRFYDYKIKATTTNPTVTDDSSKAYQPGSYWINTTAKTVYFLHDATAGAAVWERVDQPRLNSTTTNPTVTDDSAAGYEAGSFWVNTTANRLYYLINATAGAAVWERIDTPLMNVTTSNPTVSNDNTQGYESGSIWINTTTNRIYTAISVATGAAVWQRTDRPSNVLDLDTTERTTAFTATINNIHAVNTTGGAVTVTPPAGATAGQMFQIIDSRANSETNAITIATTANLLYGAGDDFIINWNGGTVTLMYFNATVGWVVQR